MNSLWKTLKEKARKRIIREQQLKKWREIQGKFLGMRHPVEGWQEELRVLIEDPQLDNSVRQRIIRYSLRAAPLCPENAMRWNYDLARELGYSEKILDGDRSLIIDAYGGGINFFNLLRVPRCGPESLRVLWKVGMRGRDVESEYLFRLVLEGSKLGLAETSKWLEELVKRKGIFEVARSGGKRIKNRAN